jgi:hypothetical protein
MAIVFAVLLPQIRSIQNSWDSRAGSAETVQHGRVLTEHIRHNLSKAARITEVSESSETNGYIEFEDSAADTLRYDIAADNYVEFGQIGSLDDLAGPVSELVFTCYDGNDLTTAITDGNDIRLINVQATLTNASAAGRDLTVKTSVYLRTGPLPGEVVDPNLVLWLKLDESSGSTAADSSGNGNDGTLTNMNPLQDWVTGHLGNALDFDGGNDYVDCGSGETLDITDDITIALWVNARSFSYPDLVTKGDYTMAYSLWLRESQTARFAINADYFTTTSTLSADTWHHIAATRYGNTRKIYIDGMEDVSDSYSSAIATTALPLTITSSDYPLNGLIDDVRIYDRGLSDVEVARLYCGTSGPVYLALTEAKAGSDVKSLTVDTPSGTMQDDLLIAAVATDGDTNSSLASPFGEGWTEIDVSCRMGQVTLGVWWKLAEVSESSSHQFSWSSDQQAYAWMMRFGGHDTSDPIDAYSIAGDSGTTTPTSSAVTATVDNTLILRLGAFDNDSITVDNPGLSGHTAITADRSAASAGEVVFRQYTEEKLWYDGTSLTLDTPSGTAEGDLLIAAVATDGNTAGSIAPPGGEGWTQIELDDKNNTVTFGVWWKIADASEPSGHQFTWTGSEQAYGWMMRFTGHDPGSPIHDSNKNTGVSSSPDCPSVSTGLANCLILRLGGFDDDDVVPDSPGLSGHTSVNMDESDWGSGTCSGGAGYRTQANPGASGTAEFSLVYSEDYVTITVAIAPVGGITGTVSGGAGYVAQSGSGSSGTSTFSLTDTEQTTMVTIAIAPVP